MPSFLSVFCFKVSVQAQNNVFCIMGNEQSTSVSTKSGKTQKQSGIVVVSAKQQEQNKEDTNISKLSVCPTFDPLLPPSSTFPDSGSVASGLTKPLDTASCLKLCVRLQEHLELCAEAVKFDQQSLVTQIKEVDRVALAVMQHLTERQRAHAKHAEHSRKLDDISVTLNKVRLNIDQSLNIADELNMLLPEDQRLPVLKLF